MLVGAAAAMRMMRGPMCCSRGKDMQFGSLCVPYYMK